MRHLNNRNILYRGPGIKLAQNMKLLRESNGLTQKKVAQYLFVDRSTYSYYESGKTQPNLKMLTLLADLYGVSIDALIGYLPRDSGHPVPNRSV